MRHGLMRWRDDELSEADVIARQARLQEAMARRDLDGLLLYTNHVRSAAVTWTSGFTPYWSDAILLVPRRGSALFATALSKRVGNWIRAHNPTSEILHSPKPGTAIGEKLAAVGAKRVGVVELDRMPRGLIDEIEAVVDIALVEAADLFGEVRGVPDAAELSLARRADEIAQAAFAEVPASPLRVGDVTEMLELTVRNAGAEECYVASAPDLAVDARLARTKGQTLLGETFAVRLSLAYNGVWIRRTETLSRGAESPLVAAGRIAADALAASIDVDRPIGPQVAAAALPAGITLAAWTVEAPIGTRPLEPVAAPGLEPHFPVPYGVLTLRFDTEGPPLVFVRPIGMDAARAAPRKAA